MTLRLSALDLWATHERRVSNIVRAALVLLSGEAEHDGNEHTLNGLLFRCLMRANAAAGPEQLGHPPVIDGRMAPTSEGVEVEPHERKHPDFIWSYVDHSEPDPARGVREFVIECKVLGRAASTRSSLTSEYVRNGVLRFVRDDYRYGQHTASGAMVGYIVSSSHTELAGPINTLVRKEHLPELGATVEAPIHESLAEFDHQFDRIFPLSPFRLLHFWVDLQNTTGPHGVGTRRT